MYRAIQIKNLHYHIFCIMIVFIICTIATSSSLLLNYWGVHKENLLMIFLIGVLISTVATRGYIYGFLSAIISVYLFNFFSQSHYILLQ